jgi:hypothetical protein
MSEGDSAPQFVIVEVASKAAVKPTSEASMRTI